MFKQINLILLLTISFQAFTSEMAIAPRKETRKERKAREKVEAVKFNKEAMENIKITKDTVFCFDLHKVVADYDVPAMLRTPSLVIPAITLLASSIYFPKSTLVALTGLTLAYANVIKHISKNGVLGAEEIQWRLTQKYPWNMPVNKLFNLGINIAAQLKPFPGTIAIAKDLMSQGYKVIFLTNIEPALWQKFIKQFPEFKNCEVFNPTPEDNWDRKPNKSFFQKFLVWAQKRNYKNLFFIDDKLENTISAKANGIPSYTFTSAEDLLNSLIIMGTAVNSDLLKKS